MNEPHRQQPNRAHEPMSSQAMLDVATVLPENSSALMQV